MAAPLLTAGVLASALLWGQTPVREVRLDAPGAHDLGYLQSVFAVEVGTLLSRTQIRAGVQALLATGLVEDVKVDVEPGVEGAVVGVEIQVASRLSGLRISGLSRRYRRDLESQLNLQTGSALQVNVFVATLRRAEEHMRARGYPDAVFDPELAFNASEGTVEVIVRATPGRPRILGGLEAPGSDLDPRELLSVCGINPGTRLGEEALDRTRRRLEKHLRQAGYWEAEVDSPRLVAAGTLDNLLLPTHKGARYRLDLVGLVEARDLGPGVLPFVDGDEAFSDLATELIAQGVRIALQQQGFLGAQVEVGLVDEPDVRVLRLVVERGQRLPIVAVRFPGATVLSSEKLRERIGARTGRPWRWGGEPVDEGSLADDAESILGTFQSEGFADAVVGSPRVEREEHGWAIEFPVTEGERNLVRVVTVEGWPEGVPRPAVQLDVGGAWSQLEEDGLRSRLLATLRERGFAEARCEASHSCEGGQCDVHVAINPGEPSVVGRIVVAGLHRTRRSVVDTVAGLARGEPLGPERQLEIQRRLLGLGVFSSVALSPIPGQSSGQERGVLLSLAEGPTRAFAFGTGWDTERKFQLLLAWSELSLWGTGRAFSVEGRTSSREQRFQMTYREPARLGLMGAPAAVSLYRSEERATTYELLRQGLWVELGDRLRRPRRALLRLEYQIVDPVAPPDVLSTLEREKQRARIASLSPTVEWDTRDDLFAPRRGTLASLQLQAAFRVLAADAEFNKVVASLASFVPVGGGVLAGSLRAGAIDHRGAGQAPSPAPIDVPISVRFFAGGRISHRAFPTDQLGIVGKTLTDKGEPIGGGGLMLANLEWRVPVWGPIGVNVFVDGGNVWREVRDFRARDVRWGAGLGLRVETPVGPLRLEYGWKVPRKELIPGVWESAGQLILSFGNPF